VRLQVQIVNEGKTVEKVKQEENAFKLFQGKSKSTRLMHSKKKSVLVSG